MRFSVFDLEKKLNSIDVVVPKVVEDALGGSFSEACKSGPVGFGYTEETGYFILMSGQGPFIFWLEKELEGTYITNSIGSRIGWERKY